MSPYNPKNVLLEENEMNSLLQRFGVTETLRDINIYRRAFVNKSYCTRRNENYVDGNVDCPSDCLPLQEESNERLEFFGDSILNTITAKYLFDRYPRQNEGFLTLMRTKLVNGTMLANLARKLSISRFMIISAQIESKNGRDSKKILEDTLEALIGAIYLDFGHENEARGYVTARTWIVGMLETLVDFVELIMTNINYKDKLVKFCHRSFQFLPVFEEVSNKNNLIKVAVRDKNGTTIAIATEGTKKLAETTAARKALEYYGESV